MSLESLFLYTVLSALLVIMPGPDFALMARLTLGQGRAAGSAAACGITLGICLHTALAMLGISAAIAHSPLLFSLLKYGGGAFLVWMGLQSLRSAAAAAAAVLRYSGTENSRQAQAAGQPGRCGLPAAGTGLRRAFGQGFLTNALNPKAVIYFLTFLPQFMDPDAPLPPQFLLLGGIMALLVLVWFQALAHLLDRIRPLFLRPAVQLWLYRLTGIFFMAFGLRLACTAL